MSCSTDDTARSTIARKERAVFYYLAGKKLKDLRGNHSVMLCPGVMH